MECTSLEDAITASSKCLAVLDLKNLDDDDAFDVEFGKLRMYCNM